MLWIDKVRWCLFLLVRSTVWLDADSASPKRSHITVSTEKAGQAHTQSGNWPKFGKAGTVPGALLLRGGSTRRRPF